MDFQDETRWKVQARLVALGNFQKTGIYYEDNHFTVISEFGFRMILIILLQMKVIQLNLSYRQMMEMIMQIHGITLY